MRPTLRATLMPRLSALSALALACGGAPPSAPASPTAASSPGSGSTAGSSGPSMAWSADFLGRVEALAVLQTLNAELLGHDSATLTLDRWCDAHRLASPAKVVAVRDRDTAKPPSAEHRKVLNVGESEPIRYRRVKLTCGGHVLSEADNWYVPSRLTPEMNQQLETTDIAFGRAVQALHFQRRTLSAKLLWSPLPDGWDMAPSTLPDADAKALRIPHEVLQHRAVLVLPDGTPISHVIETYTEQVLAFPQPIQGVGRGAAR